LSAGQLTDAASTLEEKRGKRETNRMEMERSFWVVNKWFKRESS
jgi:hypothetical protein